MIVQKCACEKSYISIIIIFITEVSLKYLQEPAAILGPQNRTQGRCALYTRNLAPAVRLQRNTNLTTRHPTMVNTCQVQSDPDLVSL